MLRSKHVGVCHCGTKKVHYQEQIQLVVGRGGGRGGGGLLEPVENHCPKPIDHVAFFNAVQLSL